MSSNIGTGNSTTAPSASLPLLLPSGATQIVRQNTQGSSGQLTLYTVTAAHTFYITSAYVTMGVSGNGGIEVDIGGSYYYILSCKSTASGMCNGAQFNPPIQVAAGKIIRINTDAAASAGIVGYEV